MIGEAHWNKAETAARLEVPFASVNSRVCKSSRMFSYTRKELCQVLTFAAESGLGVRAASRLLDVSKDTVSKFYRKNGLVPMCECGKPASHRGWCSARFSKSERRQEIVGRWHRGAK